MVEIRYTDGAIEDLNGLDGTVVKAALSKIHGLIADPYRGGALGSNDSGNLTNFRKLVVGNRTHRVVYRVEPDGNVCIIWVIAGRSERECYDLAISRLKALGDTPAARALADVLALLRPSVAKRIPPAQ